MDEPVSRDRPPAEEAFAERVAPLIDAEAGRWPAVPLSQLDRDDPRRLPLEITQELLRRAATWWRPWSGSGPPRSCGGGCCRGRAARQVPEELTR